MALGDLQMAEATSIYITPTLHLRIETSGSVGIWVHGLATDAAQIYLTAHQTGRECSTMQTEPVLNQGKARGYGRITHFLPLPTWGHDLPWAIVTQPVGIFQTPACHMKDMEILFAKIPFA